MIDKIKNCNMNEDFVFVSYSKMDKDKVYPLIVKLQEQGYNIWIDKELKSAIGEDWQRGALTAIAQKHCKALLFMVSKNSLTSAPVFAELVWSQKSNKVLKNNNHESMKIIPINVDDKWSPSDKGIKDWIITEVESDDTDLTEADYNCMSATGYIDKKYYEDGSINRLDEKGEIAMAIYDDVLESLGGSKITLANVDDIKTISMNIPDTVFLPYAEQTAASITPESTNNTHETASHIQESNSDTDEPDSHIQGSNSNTNEPFLDIQEANSREKTDDTKISKKIATLTGDITYTLYGKTYTENQSNMMLRIFAQVLNHHHEIVPELCEYKGMNCVSKTNYKLEENKPNMPSYFKVCEYFEYPTGNICVGTSYSFAEKCKKIALLLNICGENSDILVSEQIELPETQLKSNIEKNNESNTGSGKGSNITYTVYGESFTTNQADMMKIIATKLLQKHSDKIVAAMDGTYFINLTDYTNVPKEERPVYYRSMSRETINSFTISIGTTFNKQAKIAEIAKLMYICSEEPGTVTIEGEIITPKAPSGSQQKTPFSPTNFFE